MVVGPEMSTCTNLHMEPSHVLHVRPYDTLHVRPSTAVLFYINRPPGVVGGHTSSKEVLLVLLLVELREGSKN